MSVFNGFRDFSDELKQPVWENFPQSRINEYLKERIGLCFQKNNSH